MGDASPTLDQACALAAHGIAVHWLRERSKAPQADEWSKAPINTPESLIRSWRETYNLGIRLGEPSNLGGLYLHLIDLDIRTADKAQEALSHLQRMLPGVDKLPYVISGSGGASRHFYFVTDRPFRSRKLAHSADKFADIEGKRHWHWEIELFGTGKQVACPPSIHPDTGKLYEWGREVPFDLIKLGLGPFVSAETVQSWGVTTGELGGGDEVDEFMGEVHRKPLDLSDEEINGYLNDLPHDEYCEDREGWLIVGMAIHHETEGSDRGLEIWKTFSSKSKKYDPKDIRRVWDSFRGRLIPVRMPTLIKAAGIARLEREHAEDDDSLGFDETPKDPEIEALLGDAQPAPKDDIDAIGTALVADADKDWRKRLDFNEEGIVKPTLTNLTLIIENDVRTKGLARFNIFKQVNVQRGKPGVLNRRRSAKPTVQLNDGIWEVDDKVNGDLWIDVKDDALRSLIEAPKTQGGYGLKVTDRDLKAAINISASRHGFHPVREYLDSLKWDGKERVETLFIRYLGVPDNAYERMTARLTMIAAVARVYEPGHKFDFVNVFEGLQGKRKTTFIRTLAKNWFVGITARFDDIKGLVEQTQGRWICELPELSGMARSSLEDMKAALSSQSDVTRLAYDRRAHEYKRQWIPFGTTNRREYLLDDENRRFWPHACKVKYIDIDALASELDQLWAESFALFRDMRKKQPRGTLPLYLTGEAEKISLQMQDSRHVESAAESLVGQIEELLNAPITTGGFNDVDDDLIGGPILRDVICLKQIWIELLGREASQYRNPEAQMLGKAMNSVPGWEYADRVNIRPYGWQRAWRRVKKDENDE